MPFKHLYSLQIRETFAKDGVLGPTNLFDWKRVGLLIMYLCCHHPFLCSPPWFPDSLARFWYFVADHIDEFVMKPAQRAAVRKNVDYLLRRLQLPGLFVPLFLVPSELKLMRKKGWVLSSVKMALQPCVASLRGLRLCDTSGWALENVGYGPISSMQREFVVMLWFKLIKEMR